MEGLNMGKIDLTNYSQYSWRARIGLVIPPGNTTKKDKKNGPSKQRD